MKLLTSKLLFCLFLTAALIISINTASFSQENNSVIVKTKILSTLKSVRTNDIKRDKKNLRFFPFINNSLKKANAVHNKIQLAIFYTISAQFDDSIKIEIITNPETINLYQNDSFSEYLNYKNIDGFFFGEYYLTNYNSGNYAIVTIKSKFLTNSDQYSQFQDNFKRPVILFIQSNTNYQEPVKSTQDTQSQPIYFSNSSQIFLEINPLINPARFSTYHYYLNNQELFPTVTLSNLFSDSNYTIRIINHFSNSIYTNMIRLISNETKIINPEEILRLITFGIFYRINEMTFGLSGEFYFDRYLWLGLNLGASYYNSKSLSKDIYYLFPSLEVGYYGWGNLSEDFRVSSGISGRYFFAIPQNDTDSSNFFTNNTYFGLGTFLQVEWKWFYFKPILYWDFSNNFIIKFNFITGLKI